MGDVLLLKNFNIYLLLNKKATDEVAVITRIALMRLITLKNYNVEYCYIQL